MSFSESSAAPTRRKRTMTERVTENGDPLAVRKKAREAAKNDSGTSLAPSKSITQVCSFFFFKDMLLPLFVSLYHVLC
jgi:hypothetical protein